MTVFLSVIYFDSYTPFVKARDIETAESWATWGESVCRKPLSFSFFLSNATVESVRGQINTIQFVFFEGDLQTFEIRITVWSSITRIDDILSYGFRRLN